MRLKVFHIVCCGFFIFQFFSCKNKSAENFQNELGQKVIREWHDRTSVKSVKTYLNTDESDYIFVLFNPDGLMLDSARYVNDTVVGLRKYYEESSELLHYENYKNGLLNGRQEAIYGTGIKSFSGIRKNNLKVGDWKFNFPDGNPITYEYYDSMGKLMYIKKYVENGAFLSTIGNGLIDVKIDRTQVEPGDSIFAFVEIAIPPRCKVNLKIEKQFFSTEWQTLYSVDLSDPKFEWKTVFNEVGEKTLKFTLVIENPGSGEIENYQSEHKISVLND